MALSPNLLQFKSSGVYRLEFDKSQTADINVETLRLVTGHSRKGPYNTPVLISSVEDFTNVFGSIDKKLEKRGMFFHRSAIEALSRGPILALNLNKFDSTDTASFASPVTNGSVHSITSADGTKEYSKFFNTDKFAVPSDDAVLSQVDVDSDHLFHFVNIKQNAITVIIRQAQDVKEFQIIAREWYGEGNVPEFMNDFDYVSDYMVDVFVFKGEFDAAKMQNDPVYREYFNEDGLNKELLGQFSNLRQVNLEAQYTGSLIPGFKDLEGRSLYVESMINNEARRTGLFCAINEDAVLEGDVDLVGHSYDADQDHEVLSHVIGQNVVGSSVVLPATKTIALDVTGEVLTFDYNSMADLVVGDFLQAATSGEYVEILSSEYVGGVTTVICDGVINSSYVLTGNTPTAYQAEVLEVTATQQNIDDGDLTAIDGPQSGAPAAALTDIMVVAVPEELEVLATEFNVFTVSQSRVIAEEFTGATYTPAGSLFTLTYTSAPDFISISAGDYVQADEANRLARIKRIAKNGNVYEVYCDVTVAAAWSGEYVKSFENASTHYKTFPLKGASLKEQTIKSALDAVRGGTGLHIGLIDKDLIDFRYVVDTFTSFDALDDLQNKSQLSELARARQNASAILNAPTIGDFKKSTNPSFTNAEGEFKVEYIAQGGNLDKNPTKTYFLPGITEGANYAFYYGPGLLISDNGKDLIVPPAANVSNNYLDKYTSAKPWSIIAGPRRGVVGGSGLKGAEYAFDKSDRDVLEPFGINPIVFQRGVGLTILGNKTAQQSVKSALSSAHVREALIYIQDGIADILKGYVFEFNNTQTRLEIKTLADSFMESVKADGGVYEFKNIMDQSNNTDDVIDNNFGIIDTYVEPVKGLEIVVHRTTVLNTGEISTGNFS
jgi:hypothetical protein